jgi:ribonuclease HII
MAILGIDEVGRGPWAGPLTVGACVLHEEIEGLTDSKKLSVKRREKLNGAILNAASWGLGWVSAAELDEIGLAAALRRAAMKAVEKIHCSYSEIVIDGTVNFLAGTGKGRFVTTLKKADLFIPAVSAASIIAKVARDRYMVEAADKYPGYGFEKHVGYGTKMHRHALCEYGICPEHRRSFRPVAKLLRSFSSDPDSVGDVIHWQADETALRANSSVASGIYVTARAGGGLPKKILATSSTSKQIGDLAEDLVAEYLEVLGHEIVVRNWKTRQCEIDIVSVLDGKIYFTEVKYRRDAEHGSGLEVVGAEKLRQMKFAAESYLKFHKVGDLEPLLAVASVGGDFEMEDFLILSYCN